MIAWLSAALVLFAVPVLACSAYLVLLTLLSRQDRTPEIRAAQHGARRPRLRFVVVVPAHDEAAGIAATVGSLLATDYPRELFHVLVVADNCNDDTAQRARAAGADVLVREDREHVGKGHALAYAFEHVAAEGWAEAIVVVDADTVVSKNLLAAFAARLDSGAGVVQARYGVRNPDTSWRTRLMTIAFATFHDLRSNARETLQVSCGLRGNGMAFAMSLLREVPFDAFSVVEDIEYGIHLAEAGHRVRYAGDAYVLGEMACCPPRCRQVVQRLRPEAQGRETGIARRAAVGVGSAGERGGLETSEVRPLPSRRPGGIPGPEVRRRGEVV